MKLFICKKKKVLIHDVTCDIMTYLKKNKYYSTQTFWMWFLNVSSQLFVSQLVMTTNRFLCVSNKLVNFFFPTDLFKYNCLLTDFGDHFVKKDILSLFSKGSFHSFSYDITY